MTFRGTTLPLALICALVCAAAGYVAAPAAAQQALPITWSGTITVNDRFTHTYTGGTAVTLIDTTYTISGQGDPLVGDTTTSVFVSYDVSGNSTTTSGSATFGPADASSCGVAGSIDVSVAGVGSYQTVSDNFGGNLVFDWAASLLEFSGSQAGTFDIELPSATQVAHTSECGDVVSVLPPAHIGQLGGPRLEKDPLFDDQDRDFRLPVTTVGSELLVQGVFARSAGGGSAGLGGNGLPIGNTSNFDPMGLASTEVSLAQHIEVDLRGEFPGGGDPPVVCPDGISTADVAGSDPTYMGLPAPALARFPNDHAVCAAVWPPSLDEAFVPQGLALVGEGTAYVSGYVGTSRGDTSDEFCRLIRVDLRTGDALFSRDFARSVCRHGGGIAIDPAGRVWVSDTPALVLLDAGIADTTPQLIKLVRPPGEPTEPDINGSFLAEDPDGSHLWVGDFKARKLYRFPYAALLGAPRPRPGKAPRVSIADATGELDLPAKPQGATFHDGALWIASSKASCGQLTAPTGLYGFGPGAEELEFAGDGSLWAVFESGTRKYSHRTLRRDYPFFPVIARFDTTKLNEPDDCNF
jgi:hypothetical protein